MKVHGFRGCASKQPSPILLSLSRSAKAPLQFGDGVGQVQDGVLERGDLLNRPSLENHARIRIVGLLLSHLAPIRNTTPRPRTPRLAGRNLIDWPA